LDAVKRAMRVCSQVQHQLVAKDTEIKEDASPVTVADYSAQAVINTVLRDAFPDVRIVGEESAQGLCTSQDAQMVYLRERITQLANSVLDRPRTTEEVSGIQWLEDKEDH
jgi:3'(2'), 5'-bisphosphate nucleotidase